MLAGVILSDRRAYQNMKVNKTHISPIVLVQTLILAVFLDTRCLNWAITKFFSLGEGLMAPLYISEILMIFVCALLSKMKIRIPGYCIFLSLILIAFYILTGFFVHPPKVSVSYFSVFTIASFLIIHFVKVDVRLLLKATMFLPAFSILKVNVVFSSYVDWALKLPMDISYGYLVPIVANIIYVHFYFKDERKLQKIILLIGSIINLVFCTYIVLFGSRGPMLCIAILLMTLFVIKYKSDGRVGINRKRIRLVLLAGIAVTLFFIPLLGILSNALSNYNIEIDAVQKMLQLQEEEGSIANGRDDLSALAWRGFLNNPILGNGLDQFDVNYPGASYPHNFVLQILYDGGILLLLIMFPIFVKMKSVLKKYNREELALFFLIFFTSVPGALFSLDLWEIPILWLCFGLVFATPVYTGITKRFARHE